MCKGVLEGGWKIEEAKTNRHANHDVKDQIEKKEDCSDGVEAAKAILCRHCCNHVCDALISISPI